MLDITRIFEAIALVIDDLIAAALGTDWVIIIFRLKIVSAFVSLALLVVTIYTILRLTELNRKRRPLPVFDVWAGISIEKRASKWDGVRRRIRSESAADWNMAIIEADGIMDEIVKRIGYRGDSFGERLKQIEPSDFDSLNDIWEAHKVRNRIAHEGADFRLTREEAERVMKLYEKGLRELEYIS